MICRIKLISHEHPQVKYEYYPNFDGAKGTFIVDLEKYSGEVTRLSVDDSGHLNAAMGIRFVLGNYKREKKVTKEYTICTG